MSETKQIQGVCTGEMVKPNDWSEFHISVVGRQYPAKLETKKEEIKQMARAAGNAVAVWTYNEIDSGNPNPHRPGSNFLNRYLENVVVGGQLDPNLQQQQSQPGQTALPVAPQGGATQTPGRPDAERRSIERQTIVKAMVKIYGAVNNDGTPLFPDKKYWWDEVYKLDDFMVNGRPAEQTEAPPDESTFIPTAAQVDDDIPF